MLRKEKEWTFDAFVEETGLGRGYISELERGLVVPGLHALKTLADALEVTMADLVVGDTSREQAFVLMRGMTERQMRELLRQLASPPNPPA